MLWLDNCASEVDNVEVEEVKAVYLEERQARGSEEEKIHRCELYMRSGAPQSSQTLGSLSDRLHNQCEGQHDCEGGLQSMESLYLLVEWVNRWMEVWMN